MSSCQWGIPWSPAFVPVFWNFSISCQKMHAFHVLANLSLLKQSSWRLAWVVNLKILVLNLNCLCRFALPFWPMNLFVLNVVDLHLFNLAVKEAFVYIFNKAQESFWSLLDYFAALEFWISSYCEVSPHYSGISVLMVLVFMFQISFLWSWMTLHWMLKLLQS